MNYGAGEGKRVWHFLYNPGEKFEIRNGWIEKVTGALAVSLDD